MGPLEFQATRAMIKEVYTQPNSDNGRSPHIIRWRLALSDAANEFIAENNLGTFTLLFDDSMDWPVITAPDEYSATIFRLAF